MGQGFEQTFLQVGHTKEVQYHYSLGKCSPTWMAVIRQTLTSVREDMEGLGPLYTAVQLSAVTLFV